MDIRNNKVILYSSQAEAVLQIIERDGECFSKRKYVEDKYQESAPIFVSAYSWFVHEAEKYVLRPENAEYPYWAFKDIYSVEASGDSRIIKLEVPADEAVFFDMYDWNKILSLKYIGETETDEQEFRKMLRDYGITRESDVVLTNFYPNLKRQVQESWKRLFRHHEDIINGENQGIGSIQAGLWTIRKEWIVK